MQGAYGFNLYESISAAASRPVINTARGGSTFKEVKDRILGDSSHQHETTVIDDMSPNGFTTIEDFMADARAIVAFLGHERYVFVASITPPPISGTGCNDSQMRTTDAIEAALVEEFGAEHVLDVIPALQAMSNGSTDDTHDVTVCNTFPRSLLADGTHLTQAGIDAQAVLVPGAVELVEGL